MGLAPLSLPATASRCRVHRGSGTSFVDSESSVEATLALIYIKCGASKAFTRGNGRPCGSADRDSRSSQGSTLDLIAIDQCQSHQCQPGYIEKNARARGHCPERQDSPATQGRHDPRLPAVFGNT